MSSARASLHLSRSRARSQSATSHAPRCTASLATRHCALRIGLSARYDSGRKVGLIPRGSSVSAVRGQDIAGGYFADQEYFGRGRLKPRYYPRSKPGAYHNGARGLSQPPQVGVENRLWAATRAQVTDRWWRLSNMVLSNYWTSPGMALAALCFQVMPTNGFEQLFINFAITMLQRTRALVAVNIGLMFNFGVAFTVQE